MLSALKQQSLQKVALYAWLLVWAGLSFYAVLTLWLGLIGLFYPFQLDYGEGIVLWFAQELARGHAIYKGMLGLPLASSNYPPVALLLGAALMPLFGPGYLGGRLLNIIAALVVTWLIFRIVRVETGKKLPAAMGALFFLGSPFIYHWIALYRIDLIGLALAFGGVYAIWEFERSFSQDRSANHAEFVNDAMPRLRAPVRSQPRSGFRGVAFNAMQTLLRRVHFVAGYEPETVSLSPPSAQRHGQLAMTDHPAQVSSTKALLDRRAVAWIFIAGLCFLLALYTKQTLFAAPAAAFLALFMRDRRLALTFATVLGFIAGGLYLAMDRLTAGGFTFGLIESNATVFLAEQLASILNEFVFTFPILLALAIFQFIRQLRLHRIGILEWYTLTSMLVLVMAGRIGAWENYFFEAIAAVCVLSMIALAHLTRQPSSARASALLFPLLLIVQIGLFWHDHDPQIAANVISQDWVANQQLAALLERTPGMVISEDMGALVTSGKPVTFYTFQYSSLARSGKWDQSWELNGLANGVFPLVVLEQGTREDVEHYMRFTPEFLSALDRYYEKTESIGKYQIYSFAPLAHEKSVTFGEAIDLVGWSIKPESIKPGVMQVAVVWQAKRKLDLALKEFVYLQDTAGHKIAQQDQEPLPGVYPTSRWSVGENVRDTIQLNIPENSPPGEYSLMIGWYDPDSGDRLTVPSSADNSFILAQFKVEK